MSPPSASYSFSLKQRVGAHHLFAVPIGSLQFFSVSLPPHVLHKSAVCLWQKPQVMDHFNSSFLFFGFSCHACSWLSVFFHSLSDILLIVPWWHLFMWFHHSNVVYIMIIRHLPLQLFICKNKDQNLLYVHLPLSDLTVMHLCLWQWPIHPFFWLLLELGELITGTQEANGEHKVGQAQEKRSGDSQVLACFWGLH